MIASRDKPFQRAGKGTVLRSLVLQEYQAEIDALDAFADTGSSGSKFIVLDTSSLIKIVGSIRSYILSITGLKVLTDDTDIFISGVDSLQVLALLRLLRQSIRAENKASTGYLTPALIYGNPTVNLLSRKLHNIFSTENHDSLKDSPTNGQAAQELFEKYSYNLPVAIGPKNSAGTANGKDVIILTGSSGSLGSYLLDQLCQLQSVGEIWCINRSAESEAQQTLTNTQRGITADWALHNVHFLQANLSQAEWGLSTDIYKYLSEQVTQIIRKRIKPR